MSESPKQTRTFADWLVYLAVRLVVSQLTVHPPERIDRWFGLLSKFFSSTLRLRRRLIEENLHRVFPHWGRTQHRRTAEAMWLHLLRMICEAAYARRKLHQHNWYDYVRVPHRARLLRFMFDQRPKIVVTGHYGNFEMAGFMNGLFALPTTTIARELDNGYLHDYVTAFRSDGGQSFVSKHQGAEVVNRLLDRGATLALLADQEAGNRGVWVKFLGHYASCHKALALFTLSSSAPMAVVTCRRLDRMLNFEVRAIEYVDPEWTGDRRLASIEALTLWYNDSLAQEIFASPDQYWWVHRRWRDPPPRLLKKARAA